MCVSAQQFKAQRGRPRGDLPAIIAELGLEQRVLNQPWVELSVRITSICTAQQSCSDLFSSKRSGSYADLKLAAASYDCIVDERRVLQRG